MTINMALTKFPTSYGYFSLQPDGMYQGFNRGLYIYNVNTRFQLDEGNINGGTLMYDNTGQGLNITNGILIGTGSGLINVTASVSNAMPYSSSTNFPDITSSLATGSMYLQVGPPTFLFVYDGTVWRSSSMA